MSKRVFRKDPGALHYDLISRCAPPEDVEASHLLPSPPPGGSASGRHVRRQGLRRGQDGAGHREKMADRGEEAGVRVPVHRGRGNARPSTCRPKAAWTPGASCDPPPPSRCCTPWRSTPARPSTSSPAARGSASWTCRRPMRRCPAWCRSWGRSCSGARSRRRWGGGGGGGGPPSSRTGSHTMLLLQVFPHTIETVHTLHPFRGGLCVCVCVSVCVCVCVCVCERDENWTPGYCLDM